MWKTQKKPPYMQLPVHNLKIYFYVEKWWKDCGKLKGVKFSAADNPQQDVVFVLYPPKCRH